MVNKLVQLVVFESDGYDIMYGLDSIGQVWERQSDGSWSIVPGPFDSTPRKAA